MLKNRSDSDTLAVWAITPNGKALGQHIQAQVQGSILFVSAKTGKEDATQKETIIFDNLSQEIPLRFNQFSGHVFIFSTGIGVRLIAPLLKSKTSDPAIVVVDDKGTHVISLLSGHLGGANQLAKKIAAMIKATPVITTATDTNLVPAIDLIAKDKGIHIETPHNIKHISMAFLMGEAVTLVDPLGFIKNDLPRIFWSEKNQQGNACQTIFCSHKIQTVSRETLVLRPPVLTVGIGCNRGTGFQDIQDFLALVLKNEGLSVDSVFRLATTCVKADEKGMLELSEKMKLPMAFFSQDELNSVTTIENPSSMVEKHLGVKSVCEAAAILSAGNGKLIVPKKKTKDVTIAVAIIK